MEKLKKKCMRSRLGGMVILLIIGVICFFVSDFAWFKTLSVTELTSESDFESLEGKWVTYTMTMPLGYYETFTREKNGVESVQQYGYFVYDNEGNFCFGVVRDAKKDTETENMINSLWDYWDGVSDTAPSPVTIIGTLTAMDSTDQSFFDDIYESLKDARPDAEAKYYYIEEGRVDGTRVDTARFMTYAGFAFIAVAVIYVLLGLSTWKSTAVSFANKHGLDFSALENEVAAGKELNKGRTYLCKDYIITAEGHVKVIPLENLCWAYYYCRSGSYAVSQVKLFYAEKGSDYITADETCAREILEELADRLPYILVGYKSEWEKMYSKDRQGFLNLRYNPVKAGVDPDEPSGQT